MTVRELMDLNKDLIVNRANFFAGLAAFFAAGIWIASGNLGELSWLAKDDASETTLGYGGAIFNTIAAWGAMISALLVMLSSGVTMWMPSDDDRRANAQKKQAEEDAELTRIAAEKGYTIPAPQKSDRELH